MVTEEINTTTMAQQEDSYEALWAMMEERGMTKATKMAIPEYPENDETEFIWKEFTQVSDKDLEAIELYFTTLHRKKER